MRIREITSGSVVIALDPGQCLMLAEACGRASDWGGEDGERASGAVYDLAAATFEALALLGAAGGNLVRADELLADWNLPTVRKDWNFVTTHQEVAK